MIEVEPTGLSTLIQSKKEKCRQVTRLSYRADSCDHFDAHFVVLTPLRSIRLSRKRKLHEVYCVATQVDALPLVAFVADDSQPATPEESRFYHDNLVLQYVCCLFLDFFQTRFRLILPIVLLTRLYRGPFLNERNLPPRCIPPLAVVAHHRGSDSAPGSTDAALAHPKQTQEGAVKPLSPARTALPLPTLPRPANPIENRDASPGPLPEAPTTAIPTNAVASPRLGSGDLQSALEAASSSDNGASGRLSQSGASITQDSVASERPQGPPAREVAFIEPEKQSADSEPAKDATRSLEEVQGHAQDGQHIADPDVMDLDEPFGQSGEAPRLSSLRPPPLDANRPPDILSSPGSTAQTATTPAVHEASPDTSPDNEGPQYPGDDDEMVHQLTGKETTDTTEAPPRDDDVASGIRDIGASQAAAAQLLSEAVDAEASKKSTTVQLPIDQGSSGHSHVQEAGPIRPVTDEPNAGTASNLEKTTSGSDSAGSPRESQPACEAAPRTQASSAAADDNPLEKVTTALDANQVISEPSTSLLAPLETPDTQSTAQQTAAAGEALSTAVTGAEMSGSSAKHQEQEDAATKPSWRARMLAEKRDPKHRKAPIVVFEKPAKKPDETIVASQFQGRYRVPTDDYFVPLFFDGFTRQSTWMKSPEQLLGNTHKTLSSPDCNIVLQENQACKVLRRIYHLQQNDKWSLRQPKRCPEPTRPPSHWDLLLKEMKWMRTDYREERKWKRAAARNLAEACAEWVAAGAEERKVLQVNAKIPSPVDVTSTSKDMAEADSTPTPMPDLVPSDGADSPMDIDEEPQDWQPTIAPSALFALHGDEVVFGLQRSAISDQLLEELPLYGEPLKAPQPDLVVPEFDPDARWRRPALPLSKYVEGEMILKPPRPRLQQSRFKYAAEDDEDDFEAIGAHGRDERAHLPPENTDVALFRPDMKMIRDRLHAGVKFRPPTESLMPVQNFYENRLASTWTSEQDDELRKEVREHSYNWSLISQIISPKSLFVSAEDRRTPWECFERWVQLEGFPNDTGRTQYFQTYQKRIESAQRAIAQANESARPQVGPNGAVTPVQRRRSTLPYKVERKTSKRHFALIDAMKKLAKKREAAVAKQQQTANNQNRRTSNDNAQQKLPTKTPEDYSRLRHEREKQMQEKLLRFTQQQEAQRQVSFI